MVKMDRGEEPGMEDLRLCDSEYRFMCLVWEMTPVRSGDLVKAAHERLAWKKSTTYTVIKKLAERGFLRNEDALVTALVPKEECQAAETDYFMERTFEGSLPKFVAAFLGNRKISDKAMIETHKE